MTSVLNHAMHSVANINLNPPDEKYIRIPFKTEQDATDYIELAFDGYTNTLDKLTKHLQENYGMTHEIAQKSARNAKVFSKATKVLTAYNVVSDTKSYAGGEISGARYTYKMSGTAASLWIGAEFGGAYGFAAGATFMAVEMGYDFYQTWAKPFAIDFGKYFGNMEYQLNNSHWIPGKK